MAVMVLDLDRSQWRPVETPPALTWVALALALGALGGLLALVVSPLVALPLVTAALGLALGTGGLEMLYVSNRRRYYG